MTWYAAGTVTVTNGSAVVTGAGTDFIANVAPGDIFSLPGTVGIYEVASIQSSTQLTLGKAWLGSTGGSQPYGIAPTQSFARDLAIKAAELLATFGDVRDGIGRGLIPDGTPETPGVRFAADQDTGLVRLAPNKLALVTGGAARVSVDAEGNLLAGVAAGTTFHRLVKAGSEGTPIAEISGPTTAGVAVFGSNSAGYGAASPAVMKVTRNTSNGRSIGAEGTINASGADYAEYMTKCENCGTIAPGDVCGVTTQGKLTRTWGDAVSFVVKSTDPSYVGGDTWAQAMPAAPERREGEAEAAFKTRMADWSRMLEAERQKVDRIAFCGQAPVTMTGSFAAGDYVIAAANGSGIKAVAVTPTLITFEQYQRRIGRVWKAIDATHAWVDVQHG